MTEAAHVSIASEFLIVFQNRKFRKITPTLFAHEDPSESSTNCSVFCSRRICDSCFEDGIADHRVCGACSSDLDFDLRIRSTEQTDYLDRIIFKCPMEKQCDKALSYADFISHIHGAYRVACERTIEEKVKNLNSGAVEDQIEQADSAIEDLPEHPSLSEISFSEVASSIATIVPDLNINGTRSFKSI